MRRRRSLRLGILLISIGIGFLYLKLQILSIYGGDAGDLVSAIVTKGIPHPPGYPLYTLLGTLINRLISFQTPAWRIGFLSSIPAVLGLVLLYDLFCFLSRKAWISFITVLVLAFNYPLWLYGETVEVFSLNNLLSIILMWCVFRFIFKPAKKYIYLFSFVLGLSFTHHHIIIFLLPGLFYLLWQSRERFNRNIILISAVLFLFGLLPYGYSIIASSAGPVINWQGPPTLLNFFHLVTRAGYGTFRIGNYTAHQPLLRILEVWTVFNFVYQDFRLLGTILIGLGGFFLFRHNRNLFISLSISISLYLFFMFYASFPLMENFLVGTFERFVQPIYILLGFFILYGMIGFLDIFDLILGKFFYGRKKKILMTIISLIIVVYPAGLFILNYTKISILKDDFTAEKLGENILDSVPTGGILFLTSDTPLFNTQYVYYANQKRQDVTIIHLSKIYVSYYSGQLAKFYPDLIFPDKNTPSEKLFEDLVNLNYQKRPIYSKNAFDMKSGTWVPWGLLYRYFQKDDIPDNQKIKQENDRLWQIYADPLKGSLSKYRNMILADNLRIYAMSHQEYGVWLARRGFDREAEIHLIEAERQYPEDLDSYTFLSQVYIRLKDCAKAQEQIDYRLGKDPNEPSTYFLASLNHALCYRDKEKAAYYESIYNEKSKNKEVRLEKL